MSVTFRYAIALFPSVICGSPNTYVKLAPLPPFEQILPLDNLCYISGWGRTSNESHLATH